MLSPNNKVKDNQNLLERNPVKNLLISPYLTNINEQISTLYIQQH